jgi:hypothetical protein
MAKKPVVTDAAEVEESPMQDEVSAEVGMDELDSDAEQENTQPPEKKKSSVSTKILGVLALLLAGGAAGLYGGPKLAPMLPSGMAPVAQFLSPGDASATVKISNLSSDLTARLVALETAEAPNIEDQFMSLSTDMNARITALSDQVAAVDGGDIEARLTAVETTLSGLAASVDSLSGVGADGASVDVSGFQATIDGLKAQIETLSSKQGMIGQRIDDVAANTNRREQEAQTKVANVEETAMATITDITRAKAISDITGAMESGADFTSALTVLTDGGISITPVLAELAGGVMTLGNLKTDFSTAAHAGLKASIKEEAPENLAGKLAGFFKSQVTVRSLEPQDGDTTDSVLSRIQGALDDDNLTQALEQAAGLNDAAKSAMANWLSSAQTRQTALDAVSALSKN